MNAMRAGGEIHVFPLPERMDSASAVTVQRDLHAMLQPGAQLIVDGGAISYMSAAGVRTLASVLHEAQAQQARVVFCRFSGAAADCLDVSGFSQLLDVADSVEAARDRLQSSPPDASKRLHRRGSAG